MQPNLPFLLAASNVILKPGGLLRWKKRLVKDTRLSLPLTEVMKIAKRRSGLPDPSDQKKPNQAEKKPNIFNNVISIILITKDIVGVYVWITTC